MTAGAVTSGGPLAGLRVVDLSPTRVGTPRACGTSHESLTLAVFDGGGADAGRLRLLP
jgi:hypothetical protein